MKKFTEAFLCLVGLGDDQRGSRWFDKKGGTDEMSSEGLKRQVAEFWESEVCGSRYATARHLDELSLVDFDALEATRYALEPYIPGFASFAESRGLRVLEIGLGTGVDFRNWVQCGAHATGVDLTRRRSTSQATGLS